MYNELTDLLQELEKETFYGDELSHPPSTIKITYSHGKFEMDSDNAGTTNVPGSEILEFDPDYNLTRHSSGPTGNTQDSSADDVQKLMDYGLATNFFRRDPRYILQNCTDVQNPSPDVYTMRIYDDRAKQQEIDAQDKSLPKMLRDMAKTVQIVEMSLDYGFLKKMVVKNRFASGKEKVFTDIDFYK